MRSNKHTHNIFTGTAMVAGLGAARPTDLGSRMVAMSPRGNRAADVNDPMSLAGRRVR